MLNNKLSHLLNKFDNYLIFNGKLMKNIWKNYIKVRVFSLKHFLHILICQNLQIWN